MKCKISNFKISSFKCNHTDIDQCLLAKSDIPTLLVCQISPTVSKIPTLLVCQISPTVTLINISMKCNHKNYNKKNNAF